MSSQDFCLCLSVQEFFRDCNWEGKPKSNNSQKRVYHTPWQYLTVQEFLRLCNWQGQPEVAATEISTATTWHSLTVKEFFNICNWQGQSLENTSGQHFEKSPLKQQVSEFFQFIPLFGNPEIGASPKKAATTPLPVVDLETKFADLSDLF